MIMTELRTVTMAELKPILDVLTGLPEHASMETFPGIVAQLGWTLQTEGVGKTNLDVSRRTLLAGAQNTADGNRELVSVDFRVTDTLAEKSMASRKVIADVFPGMLDVVSACLGFSPTREMWANPGATWDLPNGKQVNLFPAENTIIIEVWAKRLADVERSEIRLGVDPAHSLDDRPC